MSHSQVICLHSTTNVTGYKDLTYLPRGSVADRTPPYPVLDPFGETSCSPSGSRGPTPSLRVGFGPLLEWVSRTWLLCTSRVFTGPLRPRSGHKLILSHSLARRKTPDPRPSLTPTRVGRTHVRCVVRTERVSVYFCVCTCVSVYVCQYVYVRFRLCLSVRVCLCVYVCVSVCTYAVRVCVYVEGKRERRRVFVVILVSLPVRNSCGGLTVRSVSESTSSLKIISKEKKEKTLCLRV